MTRHATNLSSPGGADFVPVRRRSPEGGRAVSMTPDAHTLAVLNGVAKNLLRDAEILTDAAMAALVECRRASGIEYVPESCLTIREAVRESYVRALTERLVTGLYDDEPMSSRTPVEEVR